MKCNHCLRGEAENQSMNRDYLLSFLKQIGYVSTVTFSGGEPTLPSGLKAIRDFLDICSRYDVGVGNFYMVTNAKVWRPELPKLISQLYNFCDDNEISLLDISTDQFHEKIQLQRFAFKERMESELENYFGIQDIVSMRTEVFYNQLIYQGRAETHLSAGACYVPEDLLIEDMDNTLNIRDGEIYVNCEGNVIQGCDWSYESQRKERAIICSVYDNVENMLRKKFEIYNEEMAA